MSSPSTAAGTCTLDANQAGNANYNSAAQVTQGFTVKNNQTITFTSTAPTSATIGGPTYTPAATSTSGLTVAITVDSTSTGVCSINGSGVVSFQGDGTCTLDGNQAGNGTYNAATQVQQSFSVGLTITSDQYSATGPKVTLSGVGATGTSHVSVAVCSVDAFPCTGVHLVSTVTTGTSPTNPWTTAATTNSLAYGTTYYAEATQATQTSPVYTFTPTQAAPNAVALANGGGSVTAGDSATVTFNDQLSATTICSAWTNSGIQTLSNATITFANGTFGNPDSFTATSSSCSASNFGTVYSGSTGYVSGTVTFTNSTIAWNPNNDTLTFTLGTLSSGSGNVHTGVAAGDAGYSLSGSVSDINGFPGSTTTFTSGSASGF